MKAADKILKPIRFTSKEGMDFSTTLNKRVRTYFKENNITKYANASMVVKTVLITLLYLVPLGFVLSGQLENIWVILGMFILMGFGMAGVGFSIMHDANHGSYSKNENINKWIGRVINLVGGYALNWKIQHNVLHHSYTNVHGYDEDITTVKFLRFSPDTERRTIHKFQFLYAWFFYGFMTVMWMTTKDFQQLKRYRDKGLLKLMKEDYKNNLLKLIGSKLFYYALIIILPIILLPISWYWVILFVFIMHYITGFILGIVFQPAHVVPETSFVQPDENSTVNNNFAIHQMQTTSNFAPKSRLFSWYVGGLNFQVEHHLFPNICHIHYKKLSKIVKETAEEFDIPYLSHRTFASAIFAHAKMLKQLGRA